MKRLSQILGIQVSRIQIAALLFLSIPACLCTTAGVSAQELRYGTPAIYTMQRDGSDAQLLVKLQDMKWHGTASWSYDGHDILFDASPGWRDFIASRIFKISLRERNPVDLGLGAMPCWSPDDKKIVFHIRPGNPDEAKPGIWIMNSDGSHREFLCAGGRARWSPDGRKLVFVNESALFVLTLENMKSDRVFDALYVAGADWSPDGKSIVYIGYKDIGYTEGELGVISIGKDTGNRRIRLTGSVGWDPSWSPDGKQIVFYLKDDTGARLLHVLSPDDGEPPVLLKDQSKAYYNAGAEWSPDSSRIVFASTRYLDEPNAKGQKN